MAKTEHYYTVFEEGNFYHLYNRTIDKQPIFKSADNFRYFLKKYDEYLSLFTDIYAYCLLGNYFHILLRIKEDLLALPELINPHKKSGYINKSFKDMPTHDIISHQFRKFFQSYAMAFNKQQGRIGTLFQTPFKRVLVKSDSYFTQLIYYIHSNPQHHNLIYDFRDWKWSSYNKILLDTITKLKKQEVIAWFGDKNTYIEYHASLQKVMLEDSLLIED